jgi:intein/homing endonuclease
MRISKELAEIFGIHTGDGYLRYHDKRKELDISGSLEEKEYYSNHIKYLFKKEFGVNINTRYFPSRKTYGFVVRDRAVLQKFIDAGFVSGRKSESVRVPKQIIDNTLLIKAFLRGYFDTDGCLDFTSRRNCLNYSAFKRNNNYYPRITINSVSQDLIRSDVSKMLEALEIKHTIIRRKSLTHDQQVITLNGAAKVNKWFKLIGSANPTKVIKYDIWKSQGFCPSNISQNQRIKILEQINKPNKGL